MPIFNFLKAILIHVPYLAEVYKIAEKYCSKKEDDKRLIKQILNAAIEELKSNAQRYIGDSRAPFELRRVRELIDYGGPHKLNEEQKDQLRKYCANARICNSDRVTVAVNPGRVQNMSAQLCAQLEKILSEV